MAAQTKPPPLPAASPPEVSTRPTRLRWSIGDILTKDGHRVWVGFAASIVVVDEPAERKLLMEVFGNPSKLSTAAVIAHFLPSLRSAAEHFATAESAEALLATEVKPRWTDTLRASVNEVGFSCGLEALAPFDVEVTSPTLQRERSEQMQRVAAERRSVDRAGHFARAAELLRQWESLKSTVPSVTPGKLLEQVNPADRGLMLDTLLMAGAGSATGESIADLWAVSGQSLVKVDVKTDSPQPRVIPLPTTAGPLRSITAAEGKLLIGARNGVMIADPANPESATVYCHPTLASEYGFTSVKQFGNRVWGCHRAGGLVGWRIGEYAKPDVVLTPGTLGGEPKQFTVHGLFAIGKQICRIAGDLKIDLVMEAAGPIVAILPTESAVIIADENGMITLLDSSTMEKTGDIHTTGRLTGAALLPWLSSSRLLLNRADGAIDCIGLEDQLLTQFHSGQPGMRAVTACAGKIAAMSSDRQRLLLWNPWDGRKTAGEVYLTGLTHHRITDLSFA